MATRSGRKSLNIPQDTPGSSSERQRTQLSPTRLSRIQEKAELQNLNDRLATYIETVRRLESENNRLSTLIHTTQETTTREVTNVKNVYEKELNDVRKFLDDMAKEKAKLQIAVDKWKTETDDLRAKLFKKEKDFSSLEKHAKSTDLLNQDLQRKVSQLVPDNRKLENQLREYSTEQNRLLNQVASLKKNLEDETLARVDMENRLQSAKEELSFKQSMYQHEITESKHSKETEISEINSQLAESYEQKLADTLKELREQYEAQMKMNKDDIETIYEKQIADLQKKLDRNMDNSSSYREELRSLKSKVDDLTSKNTNIEHSNLTLQNRIQDLEKMLVQEREWHNEALKAKNDELLGMRAEMERQLSEYRDLLDIKVALDMEISAYRKLLEGEEIRLNMSPMASPVPSPQPSRSTPVRPSKRKRTILAESERSTLGSQVSVRAVGDLDISDHDVNGKYVKLRNKGEQEIALAGWHLVQKSENLEVSYRIPRSIIIKPNSSITVWSSNAGASHNPPTNIVMKNQTWCSSAYLITTLLNNNGEEMAKRESIKLSESFEIQQSQIEQ